MLIFDTLLMYRNEIVVLIIEYLHWDDVWGIVRKFKNSYEVQFLTESFVANFFYSMFWS